MKRLIPRNKDGVSEIVSDKKKKKDTKILKEVKLTKD